jgi:PEP-CTERM motif
MRRAFKRNWILSAVFAGVCASASAQSPVVGYYNLAIFPGDNLIANQLATGTSDTLDNVLTHGVPDGSTFTEYDSAANQFLPLSYYNAPTSSWTIDYPFAPNGVGGVLDAPDSATITLVGGVVNYDINNSQYTFVPPAYGPGTYLLALAAPLPMGTFSQITGRMPEAGDSFATLDGATQTLTTATFDGATWEIGGLPAADPTLALGNAAYITLVTPEPSAYVLLGLGMAALFISRRLRPGSARPPARP